MWLYVFRSVSAAASASTTAAAAITFASHVKTVWAKPEIFGTRKVLVWKNVLDDLLVTLTLGHGCDIDKQKCPCLQDKVRTTQPITTKLRSHIPLGMLITWLDFGGLLLDTVFCQVFFENFGCVFSRSNILLHISQEWLVRLMWNEKNVYLLDTGWTMWHWPLTSPVTLTL